METIRNYLDNVFARLPKTARIAELKSNLLSTMEDKYNELKRQGKSENEAIGIVISEFGNIDELLNELGIDKNEEPDAAPAITTKEAEDYLNAKRKMGFLVGIGVFLCILGPASLITLYTLFEADITGVILLLVLATVAIGLFIYAGLSFEPYKYIENGVQLPLSLEAELKNRYNQFRGSFTLLLIAAICMFVLSPIAIFAGYMISDTGATFGVVILLLIVATAVFILINISLIKESYERLLRIGEYDITHKANTEKKDKVIGAVASVVWPLAVAIFLLCGFLYDLWHIAWIVFPITGILFGMFSSVYSILTDKK